MMNDCYRRPGAGGWLAALALILLGTGLAGCGRQAPQEPRWDFAKVDASGGILRDGSPGGHHCVVDQRTGLLWEVKRMEPGLHHRADLYSWYSVDRSEHGGEPGLEDGGRCSLPRCDTEAFVEAVNSAGLCGRNDWRLPSRDEFLTLLDSTRVGRGPTMDPEYFPGTEAAEYWTGTTFRLYPQGAWAIDTIYGLDRVDSKTSPKHVRLVNGPKDAVRPKGRGR
jgi:hypothetical protein